MRALTFNRSTPMLALLLGSSWCSVPAVANCDEPVVANVESESESIPTSSVPLPLVTGKPQQKPAAIAYSEPNASQTSWKIEPRDFDSGRQKPAQTMSVLSDWKSAPLGVKLPPCDGQAEHVGPIKSVTNEDGVRKSAPTTVPVPTEIVQVNWNIKSTAEPNRHSSDCHAEQCPVVNWNSEDFARLHEDFSVSDMPLGAHSDVPHTHTAKAEVTSVKHCESSCPDAETAGELQRLLLIPENQSEVTYLTELSELLQGESNWLFGNESLLDLAPEEGTTTAAVSYLDDLNALVESHHPRASSAGFRKTVAYQSNDNQPQNTAPQKPRNPYTSIAPDANCNNAGGVEVSTLFKSISSVQLNGLSTDPPSRSRDDVAPTAQLPRPENQACQFMEEHAPGYYTTPVRYVSQRPFRNPHIFFHQPLYYEDPNLERCGQTRGCLTTAASTMHFVTAIAFTPYLVGANHPTECVQSLPDCPTCHSFDCRAYWPGWSWKGAAAQAAAVTGLYFAFVP